MKKGGLLFSLLILLDGYAALSQTRVSLYESFSGEHCIACATANPGLQAFIATNASKALLISYPTNVPAAGPFYNVYPAIANARSSYYGITTAPQGRLNGTGLGSGTSSPVSGHIANIRQSDVDAAAAVTAPFTLNVSHAWSVTGDSVTVVVNVIAPAAFAPAGASLRLRLALVEKVHYNAPPGINGEQDFPNAVRDMYPSTAGTSLPSSWTLGQSNSYTIVGKVARYIDKNNAGFVAWIQNDADKSILQAANSTPLNTVLDAATTGVRPYGRLQCVSGSAAVNAAALLRNAGTSVLTSAKIYFRTDVSPLTQVVNWSGSLIPNAATYVALGTLSVPGGNHYIIDSVAVPNGQWDINAGNSTGSGSISVWSTAPANLPIVTGFEGLGGAIPNGWILYDADSNGRNFSVSQNLFGGPAGFGGSSWFLLHNNFYVPSGEVNYAILPAANIPSNGAMLTFAYAHAQFAAEEDELEVVTSNDCGANWSSLWSAKGAALSTAPPTTDYFIPLSTQWAAKTVYLNGVKTGDMIALRAKSDYGNTLYIDNIRLEAAAGLESASLLGDISVQPNPASASASLSLYTPVATQVVLSALDATGRPVFQYQPFMCKAGQNHLAINTDHLPTGVYQLQITAGAERITRRLSVIH